MEEEDDEFSTDEELDESVAKLATVATSQPAVPRPALSVKAQSDSSGSLGFTKELSSLLASKMGSLNEGTGGTVPETKIQDTVAGSRPPVSNKLLVANKPGVPSVANKPMIPIKPTAANKPLETTDTGRVKGSQRRQPPPPPKAKVCFNNYHY